MEIKDDDPNRERDDQGLQAMPPPSSLNLKRKHHRRAKKSWRRRPDDENGPKNESKAAINITLSVPSTSKKSRKGSKQVYLRPTNGPLLKAPRNSTQFIIDDHESSDLLFNFSGANGSNHSKLTKEEKDNEAEAAATTKDDSGGDASPDDDNFWADYSERDFQSVYETAHQEVVSNWDKKKICDEIATLERRQKELVNVLARLDPDVYIQKLQSELINLQEENKALKAENLELNPALPDSSTNEDTTDTQLDEINDSPQPDLNVSEERKDSP